LTKLPFELQTHTSLSYRIYLALLVLTQLQRGPGGLGKKKEKKKETGPFCSGK